MPFSVYKRCPICGGWDDCPYCDPGNLVDDRPRPGQRALILPSIVEAARPGENGVAGGHWSGSRVDRTSVCETAEDWFEADEFAWNDGYPPMTNETMLPWAKVEENAHE